MSLFEHNKTKLVLLDRSGFLGLVLLRSCCAPDAALLLLGSCRCSLADTLLSLRICLCVPATMLLLLRFCRCASAAFSLATSLLPVSYCRCAISGALLPSRSCRCTLAALPLPRSLKESQRNSKGPRRTLRNLQGTAKFLIKANYVKA